MSVSIERALTTTPYPRSGLNRVFAAIERLPFGGWWVYPLVFLAVIAYYNLALWATGSRPLGSLSLDGWVGLTYGPYLMGATHYILRVADGAIAAFRPASGLSDADFAVRRYELITMPAGRLWIPVLIGTIIGIGSILSASAEALAPYGGTQSAALIVFGPASVFGYAMSAIAVWQTIRLLRRVNALHHEATALDLFDTAPIYAFSRLTVQIGLGYVFGAYFTLIANSAFQVGNVISLGVIGVSIIVGGACFILPLWGVHGRLAAEKAALVRGVNLRARALQDEFYRRVDTSNLVGLGDLADGLAGIRGTREELARLSTWPWPPEVLRGFISAVLLPVVVFVITRYVGEVR